MVNYFAYGDTSKHWVSTGPMCSQSVDSAMVTIITGPTFVRKRLCSFADDFPSKDIRLVDLLVCEIELLRSDQQSVFCAGQQGCLHKWTAPL